MHQGFLCLERLSFLFCQLNSLSVLLAAFWPHFLELNALQEGPTPLYVDNEAVIAMINKNWHTMRAPYIVIQHYATQQWRAKRRLLYVTSLGLSKTIIPNN